MKKLMSIILSIFLSALLLVGCGNTNKASTTEGSGTGASESSDVPTVKMMVMDLSGSGQPDAAKVQEKLNEYLIPAAQAKLELEIVPVASYQDTLTMRVASGEPVDIAVAGDAQLAPLQQQGMFKDMSQLIQEYGKDILSAFKDNNIEYLLDSDYTGDKLYYLTNIECKGFTEYICMNKDMLDECGISPDSIHSIEDMDAVFAAVHEKHPNVACIAPYNAGETLVDMTGLCVWDGFQNYDPLSDSIGALMSFDSTELVNPYKTDAYKNATTKLYEWYKKGYIAKDVATATDGASVTLKTKNTFSSLMLSELTEDQFNDFMNSNNYSFKVAVRPLTSPMVNTRRCGTVIPASSSQPEAAMRVLNALYSNGDVMDTLCYGIKGTHYYIDDDNAVVFTEADGTESASTNTQYSSSNYFLIGSLLPAHCKKGVGGQSYHDNIIPSLTESAVIPSLGFSFDYTDVSAEYSAVSNVIQQYKLGLGTGSMNPETTLDEFLKKLDEAGINTVIAKKQQQYDEFLKNKK